MTNERQKWIDCGKGICIILVVYGHMSGGFLNEGQNLSLFTTIAYKSIYHFHMPFFFIVGGAFATASLTKQNSVDFLTNKTKVLLYPYLIWTLIQGLTLLAASNFTHINFEILGILNAWYIPVQHLWFLYSFFIMHLLLATFSRLRFYHYIVIPISLYLFLKPINSPIATLNFISIYLIFYALGACLGSAITKPSTFKTSTLAAVAFLSLSSYALLFSYASLGVVLIIELLALIGVSAIFMLISKTKLSSFFEYIGSHSLQIYLAHGVFGSTLRVLLFNFIGYDNKEIIILISTALGVAAPIISYKLLKSIGSDFIFELPAKQKKV